MRVQNLKWVRRYEKPNYGVACGSFILVIWFSVLHLISTLFLTYAPLWKRFHQFWIKSADRVELVKRLLSWVLSNFGWHLKCSSTRISRSSTITYLLPLTSTYRYLAHWRLLGGLSQTVLMTERKPPGPPESLRKKKGLRSMFNINLNIR